jgi:integrase
MATINAGKFVFQSQIAFRELVERFLALHVPTLGSATRENYQMQIKNHILPAFGDLRLCDITKTIVGTWLNAKAAAHEVTTRLPDGSEITKTCPPLSWWSRSQRRGILSGIFTKAQEWNLWDGRNPCEGIDIGQKKPKRTSRIPKAADLVQFIEGIPENSLIDREGAQLIVITACVAGLWVSEVLGLCTSDIDPEAERCVSSDAGGGAMRAHQKANLRDEYGRLALWQIGCWPMLPAKAN